MKQANITKSFSFFIYCCFRFSLKNLWNFQIGLGMDGNKRYAVLTW